MDAILAFGSCRSGVPPLRHHTYSLRRPKSPPWPCGTQGDVVLLLAYTGMRVGELVGLRIEDVDLKARRIRVRRSIMQVGGKLIEGNPKSVAGRRSIPIPQRLLPILTKGYRAGCPAPRRSHVRGRRTAWARELEALDEVARRHHRDRAAQDERA